uniref:Uncharacterized protein n=1 Tax=viral metagenome TaxID=1070528 RepID=A0A6C0F668_9ZZZZ
MDETDSSIFTMTKIAGNALYGAGVWTVEIGGIYFVWVAIHYGAAHAYTSFCANSSIYGFIASPLLVAAPHCVAFRWAINTGASVIGTMWVILGTWISAKLLARVTLKKE